MLPDCNVYLREEVAALNRAWPSNSTVNIVCHGHSIPCGYTAAHVVSTFDAYPHQLHRILNRRFPTAVINVIVSGIGGENSLSGAERFRKDVLSHRPRMVTIDYGANDRFQPMTAVEAAWRRMVEEALAARVKVILVTPAPDCGGLYYPPESKRFDMEEHAAMVRGLAGEYGVALADVFSAFAQKLEQGHRLHEYLISVNHLNRKGHRIIALSLHEWFPYAV